MVWPKREIRTPIGYGSASSRLLRAAGRLRWDRGAAGLGSNLDVRSPYLDVSVQPDREPDRQPDVLDGSGEPGWYAHLLNSFGHAFDGSGVWVAVLLAAVSIVIALGPLISNRPELYIGLGIALALGYWITGQGLGELLTLGGTDPSNGPLMALIGLSVLPLVPARADAPTPAARLMSRYPSAAVLRVLGLVIVPLAVAVTSAGTELASASGSGHLSGTVLAVTSDGTGNSMSAMSKASSSAHETKPGATYSMNMSAMAGLNVTDSNWKYTGPALPSAEVNCSPSPATSRTRAT